MSEHTPGPWRISGYNENMGYPEPVIAGMVNGRTAYVAVCIECQGMDGANARLIAAAPELLDALIDLESGSGSSPGANKKFAKARAAIAKARGEP